MICLFSVTDPAGQRRGNLFSITLFILFNQAKDLFYFFIIGIIRLSLIGFQFLQMKPQMSAGLRSFNDQKIRDPFIFPVPVLKDH